MENALSSSGGLLFLVLMILVSGLVIGGLASQVDYAPA